MPNRPRVYCPTCSGAARRIYYQDAADKGAPKNRPVKGWVYCPKCKVCFES